MDCGAAIDVVVIDSFPRQLFRLKFLHQVYVGVVVSSHPSSSRSLQLLLDGRRAGSIPSGWGLSQLGG